MADKKKKGGVEIVKEGQHLKIYVPSYSTIIIVYPEEKKDFIEYLKYIHNKYNIEKSCYMNNCTIQYREDTIYLGSNFSVKYPKFGNYLEINKIPIVLDLLNRDGIEGSSIISIIKKIKKIRGGK